MAPELMRLSNEIVIALERLNSLESDAAELPLPTSGGTNRIDLVAFYLRAVEMRHRAFGWTMAECSWLILLDLYEQDKPVQVSSVCVGSMHPPTTALRHIAVLVRRGLVQRNPDEADARRIHLVLTSDGKKHVEEWVSLTGMRLARRCPRIGATLAQLHDD